MQGPGELITFLTRNQFLSPTQGEALQKERQRFASTMQLCAELVQRNWITPYQQAQLLSGNGDKLIIGSYRIQLPIGEGGMGMVFKAIQPKLDRVVALKIIRPQVLAARPEILSRFHREARAIAQLHHPNLVILFDADDANGTPFIAMEFVEGQTFEKMVRTSGPMGVRQACEYMRQSALGLQHAYEVGLVHRDIKPSNILVAQKPQAGGDRSAGNSSLKLSRPALVTVRDRERSQQVGSAGKMSQSWGTVKILDMGLARLTETPDEDQPNQEYTPLTRAGALLGTPDFIAPEQARDARKVDIRADIYSLGCTFYYLLTGKPPFPGGTDVQKLIRHQSEKPFPVEDLRPGMPTEVTQILSRMLEKRAEDRYATPQHLADALDNYLTPVVPHTPVPHVPHTPVAETPAVAETPPPAVSESTQRAPYIDRHVGEATMKAPRGGMQELGETAWQPPQAANTRAVAAVGAHSGPTGAVAVSRDARIVASAGIDGKIRLWDFTTANPREIAGGVYRGAEFQSVVFSPAEDYAVVAGAFQGTARVWAWDWRSNEFHEWGAYRGDQASVTGIAFSPDGTKFAAAIGAFVVMWKVATPKTTTGGTILKGHGHPVRAVAFAPDGKTLVSAGEGKHVIGWGFGWLGVSQKLKVEGLTDVVTTMDFAPDGERLAIGGMDRTVKILEAARPTIERATVLSGHNNTLRLVRYLPDGRTLAVVGESGQIVFWNAVAGMKLADFNLTTTMATAAALTPDGRRIALGTIDGKVSLFGLPDPAAIPVTSMNSLVPAR